MHRKLFQPSSILMKCTMLVENFDGCLKLTFKNTSTLSPPRMITACLGEICWFPAVCATSMMRMSADEHLPYFEHGSCPPNLKKERKEKFPQSLISTWDNHSRAWAAKTVEGITLGARTAGVSAGFILVKLEIETPDITISRTTIMLLYHYYWRVLITFIADRS